MQLVNMVSIHLLSPTIQCALNLSIATSPRLHDSHIYFSSVAHELELKKFVTVPLINSEDAAPADLLHR